MKGAGSFLHLFLVFKLREETMKGKFEEIAALENEIRETLNFQEFPYRRNFQLRFLVNYAIF
jgi:hypothetical protein